MKGEELRWLIEIDRPDIPVVSDGGFVAVSSVLSSDDLRSEFCVFSASGDKVVGQRIGALARCYNFSEDESVVWCEAANSDTDDAATLFIFSLPSGERLLRVPSPRSSTGTVKRDDKEVTVWSQNGSPYKYSLSGTLLNEDAKESDLLSGGSMYDLIALVKEYYDDNRLDNMEPSRLREISNRMKSARSEARDNKAEARLLRRRGEVLLALGDEEKALDHFEEALGLYDRVGVKRVVNRLRKEV